MSGETDAIEQVKLAALAAKLALDKLEQAAADRGVTAGVFARLMPVLVITAAAEGQLRAAVNLHATFEERGRG